MQIVIDIPEGAYNLLKTSGVDWLGAEHILDAVAKGIPLPKGHGRLIDVNALPNEVQSLYSIRNAPTIIEADKAESEENNAN